MSGPKVGIYLRLSRDDEREGESASIENQRRYLTQYVHSRGWTVTAEYVDDGWSGLTFQRPQFQRLLEDIRQKVVDTVITKDLSRLGRDQIYTAYYYQIYFPQHGVRYIAAAEGFDTAGAGENGALFPFLTAANDFYTADVSRKVRAALMARKKAGKFVGARAPMGYEKDSQERGHLVPDDRTAPLVRHIFERYLALGSVTGLAKELTEQGIPTPAQRRGEETHCSGVWSGTMVRRILTNPTYAGHLTQNRRVKVNYKLNKRLNLTPDQWITVANTHQALVTQKIFDQVQALLKVRGYSGGQRGAGHLLTGLAFCADCGAPMTYVKEGNRTYMVCQRYRKGGRLHLCTSHRVREDQVLGQVRGQLVRMTAGLDLERLEEAARTGGSERSMEQQREQICQKAERQKTIMMRLYRDREDGKLDEGEFGELLQSARQERSRWLQEFRRLTEGEMGKQRMDPHETVRKLLAFEEMDRGWFTALIARMEIKSNKELEVWFRFSNNSDR